MASACFLARKISSGGVCEGSPSYTGARARPFCRQISAQTGIVEDRFTSTVGCKYCALSLDFTQSGPTVLTMETSLLSTIIASIVTAFVFGMVAKKLRLPAIFGYLLAGIAIGPYTPGFVADVALAKQLAEIGIILLMFGVGLHFSIRDLIESRKIALPGALVQMAVATVVGAGVAISLAFPYRWPVRLYCCAR